MNEFENHKRNFGSMTNVREVALRLRMKQSKLKDDFQYDDDEGEITLTE